MLFVGKNMNPDLLTAAKGNSDHFERVTEWEAPIRYALADTPKGTPVLEIGVQNGGSLLQLMGLIAEIDPTRQIYSVDVNPAPKICEEWAVSLGVTVAHFQMLQHDFVRKVVDWDELPSYFSYANFDADHSQSSCSADILEFIPFLVRGGVLVKDDVNQWDSVPDFPGMKRLDLYSLIDEGEGVGKGYSLSKHGHHTAAWQKT